MSLIPMILNWEEHRFVIISFCIFKDNIHIIDDFTFIINSGCIMLFHVKSGSIINIDQRLRILIIWIIRIEQVFSTLVYNFLFLAIRSSVILHILFIIVDGVAFGNMLKSVCIVRAFSLIP